MSDNNTQKIDNNVVDEILTDNQGNLNKLSLETLILLINTERLKHLHEKTHNEFTELKERQSQVRTLHNLIKKVNASASPTGELDVTDNEELKEALKASIDLGVEVDADKLTYTKEERDRLIDNIRMTTDDLNVINDMQLQTINRLTNERYESYQMARSILKPLHEAKMRAIKGIA